MKKIKSIWARLLVVVLSVAMMFGCMGGIVLADGEDVVSTDGVALHAVGKIPSKIELGEEFTVPAASEDVTVTVKKPNGEILPAVEGKYKAANLGNYTVTYAGTDVSYTYIINCYEDTEYFIYVENNGATIRDIVKVGTSFELPAWYLAYNDEDGNLVKVTEDVEKGWKLNETAGTGNNVTLADQGSYNITLWAGFDMDKTYSESYTVVAQNSFSDTKAPTIRNIANMPSSASVKTKVSLPVATAEDDYDENVLITVSVTGPSGAVKNVEVNEHGYAIEGSESTPVAFDNDRVTSFYPMEEGTYTVTYKATDDSNNSSTEHTYKITVSDKTGPLVVNAEDDKIPTVWGLNSVINAEDDEQELAIEIPIPEVVDNKGKFILNTGDDTAWSGDITMKVEIANPDVTVAKWDNVTAAKIAEQDNGLKFNASYPAGSVYNKYYKNEVDGVKIYVNNEVPVVRINFSDFATDNLDGKSKAGITGNWTITFSFRDANGNGGSNKSQKVYTINVTENTFEDTEAPVIEEPALPTYIIVGGSNDVYTVPTIVVSDDNDSRLTEVYELVSGENSLAVKGGEELAIVEDENQAGVYSFVNEDGQTLKLENSISLKYEATDDVGNTAALKDGENLYSIDVYTAQTELNASEIDLSGIVDATLVAGSGDKQYLGGFTVNGIGQREFVGFELSVKDAQGNVLDNVTAYAYFAEVGGVTNLYVKNISFNPAKGGNYELNIRVLDAIGNSYAYSKIFVAEKVNDKEVVGQTNATVTSWSNNGTTRTPYMLQRGEFTVSGSASDYARVFKFNGASFSLLGYEFTPLAQGYYEIGEYYGKIAELDAASDNAAFESALSKISNYGMTVTDEETASFEVFGGNLPSYHAGTEKPTNTNKFEDKAFYVTEPIYAYSESRNYNVSLTYTDPSGNQLVAKKVYERVEGEDTVYSFKEAEGEFYGRFALILDKDGTYTVTARATDASGSNSKTFTIKVGDIEAVQFELSTTKEAKTVGDTFSFRTFTVTSEALAKDKKSDVTVTYRLLEPGNTEVSAASGSAKLDKVDEENGVYTIKLGSNYTFQKSGDYTVEITLTDAAGNKSVQKYTITVSTTTSTTPTSLTMLSTILIIVGILLIAGVVFYLIRFRKRTA